MLIKEFFLCCSVVDHFDEFICRMIKIFFAFFTFNTIIKNYLHIVIAEQLADFFGLFQRFASYKLFENSFADNAMNGSPFS